MSALFPPASLPALGALSQVGMVLFMFLVGLDLGLDLGVLSPPLYSMMVAMAVATTVMTTPLLSLVTRSSRSRPG